MDKVGRCAAIGAFIMMTVAAPATAQTGSGPAAEGRSPAGSAWLLRGALNVAALSCRGAAEAAIVAGYNRLLAERATELSSAYADHQLEHGSLDAFDRAMTRHYNRYAAGERQPALCRNAPTVLATLAAQPTAKLRDIAPMALLLLEAEVAAELPAVAIAATGAAESMPVVMAAATPLAPVIAAGVLPRD